MLTGTFTLIAVGLTLSEYFGGMFNLLPPAIVPSYAWLFLLAFVTSPLVKADGVYFPIRSNHPLQLQIDSAQKGDTVVIPPGTYRLEHALIIDQPISLVGEGKVEILNINEYSDIIEISSHDVLIHGLNLRHELPKTTDPEHQYGVVYIQDGAKNVRIESCDLHGFGRYGIYNTDNGWQDLSLINSSIHHTIRCAIFNGQYGCLDANDDECNQLINNRFWSNGVFYHEIPASAIKPDQLHKIGKIPENPLDSSLVFYVYGTANWDSVAVLYPTGDSVYQCFASLYLPDEDLHLDFYNHRAYFQNGVLTLENSVRGNVWYVPLHFSLGRLAHLREENQ